MTDDETAGERRRRRLVARLVDTSDLDGAAERSAVATARARLDRLCAMSVSEAGVSGAAIAVDSSTEPSGRARVRQVCATGTRTGPLEDLQLRTGEGPGLDAFMSGTPVLVGELAVDAGRWPDYGAAALAGGTAAVFSLPLQVGTVRLGTLDLHRDTAGPLSAVQLAAALALAGLATETLLELIGDPESPTPADPDGGERVDGRGASVDAAETMAENLARLAAAHAQVHQASGFVSARTGIEVADAVMFIRASALARGEPMAEVARRIVAGEHVVEDDLAPRDGPDPAG